MGNEAIALGAIRSGVRLAAGYPGTPSTEILETIARENEGSIYVEWSTNEKAALEVAAGAAYAGARVLVTMKQVGLNVASDPLMSLAYVGVKGGMVIAVADDPGPISSQTEQDTRHFAAFSKLPVFDPSSPEEAYLMMGDAFEYSEKYQTPVLIRPTTRVCHGCASIELLTKIERPEPEGFVKDTTRWVIFPRLSYQNHIKIEERQPVLGEDLSQLPYNKIIGGESHQGIITGGISYEYVMEALCEDDDVRVFKVATPYPFPEKMALDFLDGLDEVLALEELDPVLERALLELAGKHHLKVTIKGKLTGDAKIAGENSVKSVREDMDRFLGCIVRNTHLLFRPSGTSGTASGTVCRMPTSGVVLCRETGGKRRESRVLRGYRLLYTGERPAFGYGGHLSLHGRGRHDCAGNHAY